ncbi:ferrochelatase, mitochondrial-like [Zophobas morio]|uniref:ferrochelatase, mitochondrial-like n=1 Tax=Zophobas morio TaxID=2755281 RepID=UPI0030827F5E
MASLRPKTCILFLNMGGPESKEGVYNFLQRLFSDGDLLTLPFQSFLSKVIARSRTRSVQESYVKIGGGSPIKFWSEKQSVLLCHSLDKVLPETAPHKPYISFRYVQPFSKEVVDEICKGQFERVIVFPQYPQYSCCTTGSSLNDLYISLKETKHSNAIKWSVIDRWSTHPSFVKAFADSIREELQSGFSEQEREDVVLLFTAHSLPLSVVSKGDSYPLEVAASVNKIMENLSYRNPFCLAWQSKVGPIRWLRPSTLETLKGYAKQGKNMMLAPVTFTSDHIETLYELDIELQEEVGRSSTFKLRRAPSMNTRPSFINALTDIVKEHVTVNNFACSPQLSLKCHACTNPRCEPTRLFFSHSYK